MSVVQYRTSCQYRICCEISWRDGAVPRSGWFRKRQPTLARRRYYRSQSAQAAFEGTTRRSLDRWRCSDGFGGRRRDRRLRGAGQPRCPGLGRPGPRRSRAGRSARCGLLSVTPAAGAKGVNGAAPIRVRFSAPLAAGTPMPALWPRIAGRWQVKGDTAAFTPASGYFQDTRVRLKIPGGPGRDDRGRPGLRAPQDGWPPTSPRASPPARSVPCACNSCSASWATCR